jgi:hypothetical protein
MKLNFLKISLMSLIFSVVLFSCKKEKAVESIGDSGVTGVRLLNAPSDSLIKTPIDFVNIPTTITAVDIRRECPNNAELMKTMTVIVKDDTSAVHKVSSSYILMPSAWYTIQSEVPKVGGSGGTFTFVMKPGEFAKQIYVTIPNATLLNPSALYGIGFTVVSVNADGKIIGNKTIVYEIGAKNIYDGVYAYESGLVTRYASPGVPLGDALSGALGPVNPNVSLVTTGGNTVNIPFASAGGGITWAGGTSYVAGIDGLRITMDPATNLATMSAATNGTLTNWAGKENKYDPVTKTFTLGFRWNPSSNVREYEVVLKYVGPR